MNKTKRISIMALSAALAACSVASVPVSASYEPSYTDDNPFYQDSETTIYSPYHGMGGTIYDDVISFHLLENGTYADTVYIDPAELENGDYTLSCGMYLEGAPEIFGDMMHLHAFVDGFYEDGVHCKYLTFGDITTHQYQWNDDRINMMLNEIESSIVRYVGVSGGVDEDSILSAGPYKMLYIGGSANYAECPKEDKIVDLVVDERTGTAIGIFDEEIYEKTNGRLGSAKIAHYDPETPYGEKFIRELNEIDMHCLSKRAGAWINEVTGDNQMAKFDVTIDQDTPEGVYYVGFRTSDKNKKVINYMSNNLDGVRMIPKNVYSRMSDEDINVTIDHNDMDYWLKIVVGGTEEEKAATAEETYDVNQDGAIGLADASGVLTTYAERAAGTASGIQLLKSVAADYDIDGDGEISVSDATAILTKYAEDAAGL